MLVDFLALLLQSYNFIDGVMKGGFFDIVFTFYILLISSAKLQIIPISNFSPGWQDLL
jgi:hypothetical protein